MISPAPTLITTSSPRTEFLAYIAEALAWGPVPTIILHPVKVLPLLAEVVGRDVKYKNGELI